MFWDPDDGLLYPPCYCATVLHEVMNVTLKLPDHLGKAARHRAVDESKSLSAWVASLVARELAKPDTEKPKTWMDAMSVNGAPDWFYEKDFPLEDRKAMKIREFDFED
jgi:hypothetical protein